MKFLKYLVKMEEKVLKKEEIEEIYNKDLLERKGCIQVLTECIQNFPEEYKVISIHSPWGTGKTTFVNLWKYHIEKNLSEKFQCVYFNAWENDDSNNPLLSLLIELQENGEIEDSKELKDLKSLSTSLLKISPKFLIKSALSFLQTDSELEDKIFKVIDKFVDDGGGKAIEEILKTESKLEKILENIEEYQLESFKRKLKKEFKEKLKEFQKKTDKKIIFFIDELDRCKPTYAVQMLEAIKHYFSIENYFFILSWDMEQLSYSISNFYGYNMDSGGYLRRFIDFEYTLPKINTMKYIENKLPGNLYSMGNLLKTTIKSFGFSLRDINKITNLLKTSQSIEGFYAEARVWGLDKKDYIFYIGFIFLLLKYRYPILYFKLKNKTISSSEKEELIKIIKQKTDSAIIEVNTRGYKYCNFSLENIREIINNFLHIEARNVEVPIKINNEIEINMASFVSKDVNKLIDISVYY